MTICFSPSIESTETKKHHLTKTFTMKENIILLHGALGSKKQLEALENLLSPHFGVY